MRIPVVVLTFLLFGSAAYAQTPQRRAIKSPVLTNRAEMLAERQRIAERVLQPGDSVLVRVFAYVNEQGVTQWPEVKTSSGNLEADSAAIRLVNKMKWQPAENVKRGVMVTIPVVLVRKK